MALNAPMRDWQGKRVWLVGASTGIGRATASALHAQGAQVFVSARHAQALNEFVSEHPGSVALPLDATDKACVRAAAASLAHSGGLDCVVYCAGHYAAQQAATLDLGDMVRHNEINYLGALYLLDAVVPLLLAQPEGAPRAYQSGGERGGLPRSCPIASLTDPPRPHSSTWPKRCTSICAATVWACRLSAPALWRRR